MRDFLLMKSLTALIDLEKHERLIGREVKIKDNDGWLWLWRLTEPDLLILRYYKYQNTGKTL